MFTEGLDKNALKWVREKDGFGSLPSSNLRPSNDPVIGTRYGGRGFGLPPPAKYRSGHLSSGGIPMTRLVPRDADANGSASENDTGTDSEEEGGAYRGQYSLDSSPQDDRVPNATAYRDGKPLQRGPFYASDYTYSDVSSSRENLVARRVPAAEKIVRESGRNPVGWNGYKDDESSDSAASSEFSTTQVESIKGALPRDRVNGSVGYASSTASLINVGSGARKGSIVIPRDDNLPGNDIASAPPLCKSEEIKLDFCNTQTKGVVMSEADIGNNKTECLHRSAAGEETLRRPSAPRVPSFHALALGPWHAVIAYDACVRLCLNAWARGCMEAPMFLENECSLLRHSFGLHQVLLQSEEELLEKRSSVPAYEGAASKPKKFTGKMKVQVRKVKSVLDPPTGCSLLSLRTPSLRTPSIKFEAIRDQLSNFQSILSSRWQSLRKIRSMPRLTNGNFSRQSLAYVHASARYLKQVPGLFKVGITSLRSSSSTYEAVQEIYSCLLRLKSTTEEDAIRMQPGSGEAHIFFPDSPGDDLIIEVQDSKGKHFGRVVVQVATVAEDLADKLRWWNVFREPEHEFVGKVQLYICYSTSCDDNNGHLKYGTVAETVAYDLVLEVAMKVQQFQQRNLLLHGPWKWLLEEFVSYYGVSDVYTKLRYLSYVMDVATPTADCLILVHDLLRPVLMKSSGKFTLSHQENRILGETKDQIEQILALLLENYKSLDESSFSGITDTFRPATGVAAPALEPAIKLYTLLHDILTPEVQNKLCHHFQVATKKRARRHLVETNDYVIGNSEGTLTDPLAISAAYRKMTSLCTDIKNEISTDIEIHNLHILPSFVDLPNLSAAIYSSELCNRLRAFLMACPPLGPAQHVADLVIETADFQKDLADWKISHVKGGVEAKELFNSYILVWIQDMRISLLESCKMDKVKWSGVKTPHSTTPFIDEMYDRLRRTLNDYEVIICRWPEYIFVLENAVADVEKAIVEALDKQYADVLSPLKENLSPKKFGLKYVQKLAKRSVCAYAAPGELGLLLNSLKRMLDILRPKIETQFKSWGSCMPITGNTAPGECLSEITVMLRSKFRNYLQAVVEKLAENSKLQATTKMKKILQDSKGIVVEADVRSRMQPLREQLITTMNHLHSIFESHVFLALCRGYWDRMGQDVLSFLENRKENRSWYKGSQIAVSILDDTFASQIQELRGNALQEKDLEPPRSIMEVRSILCKDGPEHKDNMFYY